MNKENEIPNLELWCKQYHERSGLKVHPSSVPVDVILDEVLGALMTLKIYIDEELEKLGDRFTEFENSAQEKTKKRIKNE